MAFKSPICSRSRVIRRDSVMLTSIAATRRKIGGSTRTIAQSCFSSASRKAWLIWSVRPLAPAPP